MTRSTPPQRGYSLVELLVVLIIAGILAVVSVQWLGNRPANAVKSVLDEIEGALAEVQAQAVATGRDTAVVTAGNWTTASPLFMFKVDGALLPTADLATVAINLFNGQPPSNGVTPTNQAIASTAGLGFRLGVNPNANQIRERAHQNAGVDVAFPAWWNAAAPGNQDLSTIDPFTGVFAGALVPGNALFHSDGSRNFALVSGTNKRWSTTFLIPVVSISNGLPVPGGPMGLIYVQANGATVYKFYNPGSRNGDGQWRRI
ncbi:MAG: prepilin-type N-terminal cleavage/methylation domain-containing protein [Acidobacteria bacterium]|nr:prepilin-type N-terminal cleavage/methylation domain-containing protein [Acidobacteriota bacterium]